MTRAERLAREGQRSVCYRLLSASFYSPDRERLLEEGAGFGLAAALRELCPETGAAAHAADLHRQLIEADELDLRVDHAALFVGPFHLKAPPYGSLYLDQSEELMGDSTLAVEACYRAAGLELTLRQPPDHIAVELEFMHYLTVLAAQALESGDDEELARLEDERRRFLTGYLATWVPAFSAAIEREAGMGFYRALGACLRTFILSEVEPARVLTA